jgi:hypothetical protein
MTDSPASALSDTEDLPLSLCEGSNLFCFSLSPDGVEFSYRNFFKHIVAAKNNGDLSHQSELQSSSSDCRPPLEKVYLLFCSGDEGIIRAVQNPDNFQSNNSVMSKSGQLCVQAGAERSEVECSHSVPIAAIKRGAQIADGLDEATATVAVYPHGWIAVMNK